MVALVLLLLIVLAAFPWGAFDKTIEQRLSKSLDRPVRIGSVTRVDHFSFHPVLDIRDVTIPQPQWSKAAAPMLHVDHIKVGFGVFSLLFGSPHLDRIDVAGAQALLIRRADGRENWTGTAKSHSAGGGPSLGSLKKVTLKDVAIRYRDAKRDRRFDVTLAGGSLSGLSVSGDGEVKGGAVKIDAAGAPFATRDAKGRWPFRFALTGDTVGLSAEGTMAAPLAFDDVDAKVSAHGAGLDYIDALVEAGLFSTQPVRMTTHLVRKGDVWKVGQLNGTVGRSDFSGDATIRKTKGHTRIDGTLRSDGFDFDDLASDAGRAKAAAKTARIGERVIPDTAIDLSHLGDVSGTLHIHAAHLLWPGSKPFRSLDGTLTLTGDTLTASPLRFGMPHGALAGMVKIEQKKAGPQLHLRLTLANGRLSDLFPSTGIDAGARGKIDLVGTGRTIRAAIGDASGHFALVASDGSLPDRTALLLGQDVGGGLFAGKTKQATLRCIAAPFTMSRGTAKAGDVRIDTNRAVTRVAGTIDFPEERLDIGLSGIPKQDSTARADGVIHVTGTIKSPDLHKPKSVKTVGGVLGLVGKAIFGGDDPKTGDTDCAKAAASAMNF